MLGIYPVANVKFSNTGFDRSTLFQGREGSCAFFRATKIRLPLLPLPPSVTRAEARQRPRFNRATTRVSIQFRPTVHHRPTVSLVFLAALRRRNFFEGFTAVLPRDPTVDLTALLSPAVSIYPATLPLFLFLFSFFLARDRREREKTVCRYRTRDASLFRPFLLRSPRIRLSFARLPHGQRGHVPVAMETGPNRDGNSPPPYSPLSYSAGVPLAASLRHVFDSYSSSPSLSLFVPRSRSHLSLIRPACQPALSSSSSLFSPFSLPVARSR